MFDRRIDKLLDARKIDDSIEAFFDLALPHAKNGAVEKNIFPAGELIVKTGPDLQQGSDTPIYLYFPRSRISDPGQNLEQRALPCSVSPDNADDLPFVRVERDIPQSPDGLCLFHPTKRALDHLDEPLPEHLVVLGPSKPISLGEPLNLNVARHGSQASQTRSAMAFSVLLK